MHRDDERVEEKRKTRRQEELKKSSSRMHGNKHSDSVDGLGWKSTGVIIFIFLFGFILFDIFFR